MSVAVLRDCRIEPYDLAFTSPWRSARGQTERRQGYLFLIGDEDGGTGIGECAPLPMAGTEDADTARVWLRAAATALEGRDAMACLASFEPDPGHPAASCAVECALLDLVSTRAGRPLREWLVEDAGDICQVNASLGALDAGITGRAKRAVAAGFKILKIKLATAPPSTERSALEALAATLPLGASLRLDANGAWTQDEALIWLRALEGLPIESLEEPLRAPSSAGLRKLQARCDFPLALDESLPGLLRSGLPPTLPVARMVLKPMVLGGVRRTLALARALAERGGECVVTTTLEAAPGRWLVAHCAAALGNALAHGLDTGDWLVDDLGPGPPLHHGCCRLPSQPGLGFRHA